MNVRPVREDDHAAWLQLWADYNAARAAPMDIPDAVTQATWRRMLDDACPLHGLVAGAHKLYDSIGRRLDSITYSTVPL